MINCTLFAKCSIVETSIITQTQLINELESNVKLLSDGKEFPVQLTEEHSFHLLKINHLKTYYESSKLIVALTISLPTSVTFSIRLLHRF